MLRYAISHPDYTTTIIGMRNLEHLADTIEMFEGVRCQVMWLLKRSNGWTPSLDRCEAILGRQYNCQKWGL